MNKITKYVLIVAIGALWWPVHAQTVTETVTIDGTNNSLYKDVKTEDIYAGSGFDIGRYLNLGAGGDTLNNEISRTYYAFDVEDVLSANNLTINSVKLKYTTIKTGSYTYKITNTESITKPINDLSQSERESYYAAIGNASALHQGLAYNGNGNTTTITSTAIKNVLESDLSKKILYLGALSQSESTDGSDTQLVLKLEINYTYSAYEVTVRNDFNGSPDGGQVGVSKNSASLVSQSAPYNISVVNGDIINVEAYDNQVQGDYTWVFNDTEATENTSRWRYNNGQTISTLSSSKTTSHTANNDQGNTLFNEQKKLFNVVRKDQTELGTFTGQTFADVVDGNTRDISAPATKTISSRALEFVGWTDVSSTSQNRTVTPTDHTDYTALYKGSQISDNNGTFKTYQRKVVRSRDGWEHMVYESLGRIWYEAKAPTGDWQIIERGNGPYTDNGNGTSPSIDFNVYPHHWTYMTVVAWQEGTQIYYQVYFNNSAGSYNTGTYSYFTHGQSSSYNTQPNVVWTDYGEFAIFWKSSTGIQFKIFEPNFTECCVYDEIASGTVSNTSGASNFAVSSLSYAGDNNVFEFAYQKSLGYLGPPYYTGDEIRYTWINYVSGSTSVTQASLSPIKVSASSVVRNKEPSIISLDNSTVIGWVSGTTTNSSWDPWNTRATTAVIEWPGGSHTISRNNNDHHVRSVSLGKLTDGSEYYAAWSQVYDQTGYIDYNKFVKGSALTTFKTLNTKGWDVQLTEASVDDDIRAFSYLPKTQPYYWSESNSLGSYLKTAPLAATQTRGVVLSDSIQASGFYYGVGEIRINGDAVGFAEMDGGMDNTGSVPRREITERHQPGVTEVLSKLTTEPFYVSEDDEVVFTETYHIGDSLTALNLLGEDGYVTVLVNLVDHSTGETLAGLREQTFSAENGVSQKSTSWKIRMDAYAGRKVRIQLAVESNIEGLAAELENTYTDDYARGKTIPQEYEELSLERHDGIASYDLGQNYPNPFNPTTQIEYQIPTAGLVSLEVFDMLGRKIQTLVNDVQEMGKYTVTFDASSLASGTYIYRLTSGDFVATQKMFLIK